MSTNKQQYIEKNLRAELATLLTDSRAIESKIQSYLFKVFVNVIDNSIRYDFINELFNGLNEKAVRKELIKQWVHRYTPLRWDSEKNSFERKKKSKWDRALLNEGMHNPWFNYVPKPRATPTTQWNKDRNFKSIKKSLERALELANDAADESSIRLLQSMIDSLS